MNNEIIGEYTTAHTGTRGMGYPTAPVGKQFPFMKVDDHYLSVNPVEPNAQLKWKVDGKPITYIADPYVVGLLTLEPAGYLSATGAFTAVSKRWFQNYTTGVGAPFFAFTAGWRAYMQSLVTNPWQTDLATGKQIFSRPNLPEYYKQSAASMINPTIDLAATTARKGLEWQGKLAQIAGLPGAGNALVSASQKIPRQLSPVLEQHWNAGIQAANNYLMGTSLGQMMGPFVPYLTRSLMSEYANIRKYMESSGGIMKDWHIVENEKRLMINKALTQSNNPNYQGLLRYLDKAIQSASVLFPQGAWWTKAGTGAVNVSKIVGTGVGKAGSEIFGKYKEANRGVADAANVAWAIKNKDVIDPTTGRVIHPSKLVTEMRALTGDPSERGSHIYENAAGQQVKMPFFPGSVYEGKLGQAAINTTRGLGAGFSVLRENTPWSGVLVQSPARTAAAWINNPIRFSAWYTATQILPEMAAYLWNRQLGPEYLNYMMDERSDHNRNNKTYIGIPGKKPWEGVEMENYQEGIIGRGLARVFMDQAVGRSPNALSSDVWDYLGAITKTMVVPPMPSTLSMVMAGMGVTTPEGYLGEVYTPSGKGPPREYNKRDNVIERVLRQAAPVLGDFWGQTYAAWHLAEGGTLDGILAVGKQLKHRAVERTPVARDIIGYRPPPSGSTRITEEIYQRRRLIDGMKGHFRQSEEEGGKMGQVLTGGKSKTGFEVFKQNYPEFVEPNMGKGSTKTALTPVPGIPQPEATNPLYKATMQMMDDKFGHDVPEKGGSGYLTMWNIFDRYAAYVDSMRNVSEGTAGKWKREFDAKESPEQKAYLVSQGVNINDFRSVRDYYINKRDRLATQINYYIKAAETEMDQLPQVRAILGPNRHFTLDMANPYDESMGFSILGVPLPFGPNVPPGAFPTVP